LKSGRRTCTGTWSASSRKRWPLSRRRPGLRTCRRAIIEDEFRVAESYQLNETYYASLGGEAGVRALARQGPAGVQAVGFAPRQNVQYYQLQDFMAHVWIAHQRYPTKGPRMAPRTARNPFVGLNDSPGAQRAISPTNHPCASTCAAQHPPAVPDGYGSLGATLRPVGPRLRLPARNIIEALGAHNRTRFRPVAAGKAGSSTGRFRPPTIHASPDGPWFFIIARSKKGNSNAGHHRYGDAAPAGVRAFR